MTSTVLLLVQRPARTRERRKIESEREAFRSRQRDTSTTGDGERGVRVFGVRAGGSLGSLRRALGALICSLMPLLGGPRRVA